MDLESWRLWNGLVLLYTECFLLHRMIEQSEWHAVIEAMWTVFCFPKCLPSQIFYWNKIARLINVVITEQQRHTCDLLTTSIAAMKGSRIYCHIKKQCMCYIETKKKNPICAFPYWDLGKAYYSDRNISVLFCFLIIALRVIKLVELGLLYLFE